MYDPCAAHLCSKMPAKGSRYCSPLCQERDEYANCIVMRHSASSAASWNGPGMPSEKHVKAGGTLDLHSEGCPQALRLPGSKKCGLTKPEHIRAADKAVMDAIWCTCPQPSEELTVVHGPKTAGYCQNCNKLVTVG